MAIMKDKPRDDLDESEFTQGQHLDEEADFSFFDVEFGSGHKRSAGTYHASELEIEFASAVYEESEPDYSKLEGILPSFERDLERLELERDKFKDRFLTAWREGDMVSYLALETRYVELSGFIKGLNVLKDVLRHFEEYEWGEMTLSHYYGDKDVLKPTNRRLAQKKFDVLTAKALQILAKYPDRDESPS